MTTPKDVPKGYDHLECRDFGHAWKWSNDIPLGKVRKNGRVVVERQLTCRTCGTLRRDTIQFPSMVTVYRSYQYAAGYAVPGKGHIPSSVFRAIAFRQKGL